MKISKPTHKQLKKECDILWSKLVKLRAGMKSELSGKTEYLHSHHLRGKSCYALRYSLENGFCCTGGEHKFGFHHAGRVAKYEELVKRIRDPEIFNRLELLPKLSGEIDLAMKKIELEYEIGKYE